jgi:aspartate racemase
MKTLGIIGGIAPESTIQYYRLIVSLYREGTKDGTYPSLFINSIDMKTMLDLVGSGDRKGLVDYLLAQIEKLKAAGAEFCLLASNTPHIVFDDLEPKSPVPLISIVETACSASRVLGLKRVGLFGTAFTMQGRFYQDTFLRAGIEILVPGREQQDFIHSRYMGELVNGVFLPGTRNRLLEIAEDMRRNDGIEGLVLGGTELPLILDDPGQLAIPVLDTTRIHAEAAIARLLS